MINKIIGSIVVTISIISFCSSIILLAIQYNADQNSGEIILGLFSGGFFGTLIGMIIFRHGVRGVFEAYRDGTPKGMR